MLKSSIRVTAELQLRVQNLLSRPGRRILGITGPPGSGKSTIAAQIAQHFSPACVVLPMDGFHLSNLQLKRVGRVERKGAPDTFDAAGYIELLQRIRRPKAAETIYAPEFHREIEESIAAAIAIPADVPLVVTEGNYLLLDDEAWRPVRHLLDDSWYIDTPDALRQSWLVRRHQQFGRSPAAASLWVEQIDEPNARRIATTRHNAAFFVTNCGETALEPDLPVGPSQLGRAIAENREDVVFHSQAQPSDVTESKDIFSMRRD